MQDLTNKVDNDPPPNGVLPAAEWNGFAQEALNVVTESGQTADVSDLRQMMQGVAVGGRRIVRVNGDTAQIGEIVLPDNSAAAPTINLPNAGLFTNATVYFEQVFNQPWDGINFTVGRNGNTIGGLAEDLLVDIRDLKFKLVFNTSTNDWTPFLTEAVGTTV